MIDIAKEHRRLEQEFLEVDPLSEALSRLRQMCRERNGSDRLYPDTINWSGRHEKEVKPLGAALEDHRACSESRCQKFLATYSTDSLRQMIAPSGKRLRESGLKHSHRALLHVLEVEYNKDGYHLEVPSLENWLNENGEIVPHQMFNTRRAEQFRLVFSHHAGRIQRGGCVVGHAAYLPCSLTPPEFMRAYHEAYFRNAYAPVRESLVTLFNAIGDGQRTNLVNTRGDRMWELHQLTYAYVIEDIVEGLKDYQGIDKSLRRRMLEDLLDKVEGAGWGVKLWLLKNHHASDYPSLQTYANLFEHCDSIVVVGTSFAFERDFKWRLRPYVKEVDVAPLHKALNAFKKQCEITPVAVPRFLRGHLRRMH